MLSVKSLSVLALAAGSAMAMPAPSPAEDGNLVARAWWGRQGDWPNAAVWVTKTDTVVVATVVQEVTGFPTAAAATTVVVPAPAPAAPTPEVEAAAPAPSPAPAPAPAPAPQVQAAPQIEAAPAAPASSSAAPSPAASPSSGGSYLDIVNAYRSAAGLSTLTESSQLVANAQKTVDESGGQLKHELNPGSMAQVLAPGSFSNFYSIFYGGWLCEIPSLPGLNGICPSVTGGWDHSSGETGHADILSSTSYKSIGCAVGDGICGCDLA